MDKFQSRRCSTSTSVWWICSARYMQLVYSHSRGMAGTRSSASSYLAAQAIVATNA